MNRAYTRIKLFEISDLINLEALRGLLTLNYNREIGFMQNFNVTAHEKILMNGWRKGEDDFIIHTHNFNKENSVKYISCTAFIEMSNSEKDSIIDNNPLPRANRVKGYEYATIFFEYDEKVYCAAKCSENIDLKIRSYLMGSGRSNKEYKKLWGDVKVRDIWGYNFSSSFFYWLIKQNNKQITINGTDMNINSIRYINNSSEKGENNYSSEGSKLEEEPIPKTSLGVDTIVDSLGVSIDIEDDTLEIRIENDGVCLINKNSSSLFLDGMIRFVDDYWDYTILKVYCEIIPGLRAAFEQDCNTGKWSYDVKDKCRKQWALDVINELCIQNGISIDEIKDIDCYK